MISPDEQAALEWAKGFSISGHAGVLAQGFRRLEEELSRCGQKNCMGYIVNGIANWVRAERLIEAEAKLAEAEKVLRKIKSLGCNCDGKDDDQ